MPQNESVSPTHSAKAAGLRYVSDQHAGFMRQRKGRGFVYSNARGQVIHDQRTLARIRALAIPPAWEQVWICSEANGHLQATGRDSRGRKQYRYHHRWRDVRDDSKFSHLIAFAQALPRIRRRVRTQIRQRGHSREKVLATIIKLLETSLIRVGNREYVRHNGSYGLTTLRDRHVNVSGDRFEFVFRGKGGKQHHLRIEDRRLANVLRHCQDLPGQELFQYIDDAGRKRKIESGDVNAYLREISGGDFTAKDFRTWNGTVIASGLLRRCKSGESGGRARRNVKEVINQVAARLGNTPAICRKCYVHPAVIHRYLAGHPSRRSTARRLRALPQEEARVLLLLEEEHSPKAMTTRLRRQLKDSIRRAKRKRSSH